MNSIFNPQYTSYEVTELPSCDPIDRAEVKSHLRVVAASQDSILNIYIKAATTWAENYTQRKFINQTVKVYYDTFPVEIFLPLGKVSAVNSIKYYDVNDQIQTLNSNLYQKDLVKVPSRITMKDSNGSFPDTKDSKYNAVEIEYVCGYGNSPNDVPADIKNALLLIIGDSFSSREDRSEDLSISKTSLHLLSSYRLMDF